MAQTMLRPRGHYLDPPDEDYAIDVANQTPMFHMALKMVANGRDAQLRDRLENANPKPGASPTAAPTSTPPTPAPQPANVQPFRQILSPPEWAQRFMPALAAKPKISRRQREALDAGYKAYAMQIMNAQEQERYGRVEAGVDRRHGEEMKLRRDIANIKQTPSAKEQLEADQISEARTGKSAMAAGEALARMARVVEGDPLKALTADAITEQKAAGKSATQTRDMLQGQGKSGGTQPSLVTSGAMEKALYGERLGASTFPGLLDFTKPAEAGKEPPDKLAGWMKLKEYADQVMPAADPGRQKLLQQVVAASRPTPQEFLAAFNGRHELFWGEKKSDFWSSFLSMTPVKAESESEKQKVANARAIEYLRLLQQYDSPVNQTP